MTDYKEMYLKLFRETSKALDIINAVHLECEEMYMNSSDAEIIIFEPEKGE